MHNKVKIFKDLYHTYFNIFNNRKSEVYTDEYGNWGCRFWENNIWQKDEIYKGHSESYAESAAENYVEGIKNVR
tara:strand:- start:175 stop:396 length:222 start_codon:yes stop_codon:yes gene_type:complete